MEKVNSHSTGKLWENTNIPKVWVSYIFRVKQNPEHVLCEALIHTIPKIC